MCSQNQQNQQNISLIDTNEQIIINDFDNLKKQKQPESEIEIKEDFSNLDELLNSIKNL